MPFDPATGKAEITLKLQQLQPGAGRPPARIVAVEIVATVCSSAVADVLESTPGFLVWRLAMKWRAAVDRAVSPLGLTHAQYSLLASLRGMTRDGSAPSQRELADRTGLDPIFVSKLVKTLVASGSLSRVRDPGDARAVQLRLTSDGCALVDEAIRIVLSLQDALLAPLGGRQSRRTGELTSALRDLLTVPDPFEDLT